MGIERISGDWARRARVSEPFIQINNLRVEEVRNDMLMSPDEVDRRLVAAR
jgi:hypothetical protein